MNKMKTLLILLMLLVTGCCDKINNDPTAYKTKSLRVKITKHCIDGVSYLMATPGYTNYPEAVSLVPQIDKYGKIVQCQ